MPSKAKVKVTKVRTTTTAKVGKSRNKSGGNPNKCPICGKFMGMVHMDKHNAKTRKKLKQISSVKDFESLIEQTMLSEEEKKILWLHYKEQKTMAFIADELGMSEITVKKKHSKILMKIGKMF